MNSYLKSLTFIFAFHLVTHYESHTMQCKGTYGFVKAWYQDTREKIVIVVEASYQGFIVGVTNWFTGLGQMLCFPVSAFKFTILKQIVLVGEVAGL